MVFNCENLLEHNLFEAIPNGAVYQEVYRAVIEIWLILVSFFSNSFWIIGKTSESENSLLFK